jgi:hypothetical protein
MQVSARVVSGSERGENLIKGLDEGLSMHIIRALVHPGLQLPYVDCHIHVLRIFASLQTPHTPSVALCPRELEVVHLFCR